MPNSASRYNMRLFAMLHAVIFGVVIGIGSSSVADTFVEVGERTNVGVVAGAYDNRTMDVTGCANPYGCTPDLTRDSNLDPRSRWSCKGSLAGKHCWIRYEFQQPQDVVAVKVAFGQDDYRGQMLKIKLNGWTIGTLTSWGGKEAFHRIGLHSEATTRITLEPIGLTLEEWISIKEVKIMVR